MADQGLGLERMSRIQENKALAVERMAQAAKDEDAATLDMIKAIKEIEGIDFAHIEQLLSMLSIVKQQEQGALAKTENTQSAKAGA